MLGKIVCMLGIHSWRYVEKTGYIPRRRFCRRCEKAQFRNFYAECAGNGWVIKRYFWDNIRRNMHV